MSERQPSITYRLRRWSDGDTRAARDVLPWVYDELKRIAASYVRRERPDLTLQATALVHEAYLKLFGTAVPQWQSRTHFLGLSARLMRQLLVGRSRRRAAANRGDGEKALPLNEALDAALERAPELENLDQALHDLATLDPEAASVVQLRCFGGLTGQEMAEFLDCPPAAVERHWWRARAWLYAELDDASI